MRRIVSSLVPILLLAGSALVPATAEAQNPFLQPNESWITIDGTVIDVMRDQFTLDFGDGVITVEFDDGDRDADAYVLRENDEVTVTGQIDDDFLEVATIEASSVYVKNLGTYFYASSLDDEDRLAVAIDPADSGRTIIRGTVTSVGANEFTINSGFREVTVEVDEMAYNPLDDVGYQKIDVGDYVSVTAVPDYELFDGRVLEAISVTTILESSDS